jgi:hypothetical protein
LLYYLEGGSGFDTYMVDDGDIIKDDEKGEEKVKIKKGIDKIYYIKRQRRT